MRRGVGVAAAARAPDSAAAAARAGNTRHRRDAGERDQAALAVARQAVVAAGSGDAEGGLAQEYCAWWEIAHSCEAMAAAFVLAQLDCLFHLSFMFLCGVCLCALAHEAAANAARSEKNSGTFWRPAIADKSPHLPVRIDHNSPHVHLCQRARESGRSSLRSRKRLCVPPWHSAISLLLVCSGSPPADCFAASGADLPVRRITPREAAP